MATALVPDALKVNETVENVSQFSVGLDVRPPPPRTNATATAAPDPFRLARPWRLMGG